MPKYRCIAVSVISQWELKLFPEFPYPQLCNQISNKTEDCSDAQISASVSESSSPASKADSISARVLPVSCYIPSVPGIRFSLKYTIEPPYPEGQLFYFKLVMNGRHIASWGIDPRAMPRGQVAHALFETDAKHGSAENGREILRSGNIESRPFIFGPKIEGTLAAVDGGVIQVSAFRARARKRRALGLEQCRPQENYGISLPNVGPLDKPQDTRFYDWSLVDPIDEPYAAFHFHYRSWEHLEALELIQPSHSRLLLKPSNSFAFMAGLTDPDVFYSDDETESDIEEDSTVFTDRSKPWKTSVLNPCKLKIFDDKGAAIKMVERKQAFGFHSLSLKEKADQFGGPPPFSIPQSTLDEWEYERPLPRLPKAKPSFEHYRSASACSSNAPSITPSLRSWLDRDSANASPDPIITVAKEITIKSLPSSGHSSPVVIEHNISSHDKDIKSPSGMSQKALPNPLNHPPVATLQQSGDTKQTSRHKKSWSIPFRGRLIIEDSTSDDNYNNQQKDSNGNASSCPPEAEWLGGQRKPSSMKRGLDKIVAATKIRQLRKKREDYKQQRESSMSRKENINERKDINYDADVDSCLDAYPTYPTNCAQPNGSAAVRNLQDWI